MEAEYEGDDTDLLMLCEEEEPEIWPPTPETDEKEKDEGLDIVLMEEESDPLPFKIVPISIQPVMNFNPPTVRPTVKSSGRPLGFRVNGRVVSLVPGDGSIELKLRSHPKGSASGFTTVQIPDNVAVHNPAGFDQDDTTDIFAPLELEPDDGSTPIITGVVSGEAAQKVLSDHNLNFKSNQPQKKKKKKTPSDGTPKPLTTPPASQKAKKKAPPKISKLKNPQQLLRKGQLAPVAPPDCLICLSPYKLIKELRGFMCLCSPAIAESLKNLKKKNKLRLKNRAHKTKPSKPKPVSAQKTAHRLSDEIPSEPFTSPVRLHAAPSSSSISPVKEPPAPDPGPPQGKLVILVEDFYYGSARGRTPDQLEPMGGKFTGPYRCIHCPLMLSNNIRLMSHMRQHAAKFQDDANMDAASSCPHCYRHFMNPFKLQCHVEKVHSHYKSTVTCRICELDFDGEPALLCHMKNTHKPGEMPYSCQVCDFRSSFYSELWSHFEEVHANTKHMLCQYCLRVLRSNTCFQQHFAKHQKKHVFGCDKCRLHFLYFNERSEHKHLHHKTHVRPPQLTGLKPGTKVTVRTYSVVSGCEKEEPAKRAVVPCKVVDVDPPPPPPPQEAQRRRVESLGALLDDLSEESDVSRSPPRCVECLYVIQDFRTHFLSRVRCSLCRFTTCCSTSYANHMINNHATCRRNPHYQSIFLSYPRLLQKLKCGSCPLSTHRGDVMANHLTVKPDHCCKTNCYKTKTETSVEPLQPTHTFHSAAPPAIPAPAVSPPVVVTPPPAVKPPVVQMRRGFVPIHLFPRGQRTSQLCVKPLTAPSALSSPPAMTIKILRNHPQPEQAAAPPALTESQLSTVLSSLCVGLSHAAQLYQTSSLQIRTWTLQQERGLADRKWSWDVQPLAEQLLSQREQQLNVSEESLLQAARAALGEDAELTDCYSWSVDFMLRRDISLQTSSSSSVVLLPNNIRQNIGTFIQSLCSQIQTTGLPPHCLGAMDEFSIYIHLDKFSSEDSSAFQLSGSAEDSPAVDVVLAALSDGTLLTPLLFFRGAASLVPDGFPDNVLLEARQEGFTDEERLQIWIDKVWRPRVSVPGSDRRSVLMVDVHRGHQADGFREALSSASTDLVLIPAGCSCRLQPLSVCVTPVLKDFLQARWTQLVSEGGLDGLGLDQLALTLACWISEVSSTLNSETDVLRRSFSTACDPQQVDDRREAEKMIGTLTEALIQPMETQEPEPGLGPGPELELLLLMEEEKMEGKEEVKWAVKPDLMETS